MTPLRILVVEDDAVIGMLLGEMLEVMGHSVCAIATNEAGAVIAAAEHSPDLMIVDVGLGEGSGLAAMDAACLIGARRHLFVSGDAERVRSQRPGALVLQKPYNEAALARGIEQASA
jgi:DNA-binding response OmpR family regulator